jgi:hypothetical protein
VITAGTNSIIHSSAQMATSGLVSTIGVRIVDSSGTTIKSRVTSGIIEVGSSGFYIATIDLSAIPAAPTPGHYYVMFDNGSFTPGNIATEDLYLGGVVPFATALRNLQAISNNYNGENLAVGIFNFT